MIESNPIPSDPTPTPTRGEIHCRADGTLVSGSDDLARLLGWSDWEEMQGSVTELAELLADPLDRERLGEGVHNVLSGDETRWVRKNGTAIWLLSGVTLLEWDPDGNDLLEVTLEDVTDRRGLEDQLRQGQKMELLGQLTGGVIHDFNNILATILTHTELLEDGIRTGDTEEALQDLKQLRLAAERGTHMVRHLLVFSRPEDLERNRVSLNEVARGTAEILRRLLPQTIEIEMREVDELHALADPGAIQQILMNLATNARDAMPRGGRLEIAVVRTHLDRRHLNQHGWGEPGEYACIEVNDNGIGMAPEIMARIFEPFFTTKEKGKGTGLGLPMVYGLMKQHRGFVEVTAAEEGGTRVRLYFRPAPDPPRVLESRPESAPRPEGLPSGPLLLVEDDEALRTVMERSLRRAGYQVLTARDGHEALDLLDEGERPELIIADVVMPGMGGVELQKILASAGGSSPPVLLTSGLDPSRAFQGEPVPDDIPFLQKPWTIEQLQARVAEILNGR